MIGSQRWPVGNLGGRSIERYPSVYHLFARIRDAMPGWDINSVSPLQKVDIVAYLLKEYGVPAGSTELPFDVTAMKTMRLGRPKVVEEPGFQPIFNGRDFAGMKFLFGFNCTPAPDGCGKTAPTVFRVENGTIIGSGRYHGYWYTENKYLNFELRLEFRWVPPADYGQDEAFFSTGSSGYLLFVTEHRVWPRSIEIEGDHHRVLWAGGMAAPIKSTYDTNAAERAIKGAGYWNDVRIVARHGQVESYLNGALTTRVTEHPFREPGHIAFQYQGGTIVWRNIRIRAE